MTAVAHISMGDYGRTASLPPSEPHRPLGTTGLAFDHCPGGAEMPRLAMAADTALLCRLAGQDAEAIAHERTGPRK